MLPEIVVVASFLLVAYLSGRVSRADEKAREAQGEMVAGLRAHHVEVLALKEAHQRDRDEWAAAAAAERQELVDRLSALQAVQDSMPPVTMDPVTLAAMRHDMNRQAYGESYSEDDEQAATEDEDAQRMILAVDAALQRVPFDIEG